MPRAELRRLVAHHFILAEKLAIPSNDATRAALSAHLAKVDDRLRRMVTPALPARDPDPYPEERAIAKRTKVDRIRRKRAREDGNDDYAGYLTERIQDGKDRLQELRDRGREPTAEDARRGLTMVLTWARASFERAVEAGDGPRVQEIEARIERLEGYLAALPGGQV